MQTPSRIVAPKSYQRSQRAETRNRLKDELKRLSAAVDKVRKWEKRWVHLKDSSISVYKWVPVSGAPTLKPVPKASSITIVGGEDTNASMPSAENSNDATNTTSVMDTRENFSAGHEEDSNMGFSEAFDSDSNQTQTFDRVDYRPSGGDALTDFSAMVREEAARENEDPNA